MIPQTVVESPAFSAEAAELLGTPGRDELVDFLANNPHAVTVIPDSGGIRKLRWKVPGAGKRGGARVIYYVCDIAHPVFLLAIYAKNRKFDLTPDERRRLKVLIPQMVRGYGKKL